MPDDKKAGDGKPKLSFSLAGPKNKVKETKIKAFSLGVNKTSRLEKHKQEQRKRQEEEERRAQELLGDFVKSFEADESASQKPGQKGFVRGETIVHGPAGLEKREESSGKQELYIPPVQVSAKAFFSADNDEDNEDAEEEAENERKRLEEEERKRSGKKDIDVFLEELKREQAERAKSGRPVSAPGVAMFSDTEKRGSFTDPSDRETTNLYIGNLHPGVTEEMLLKEFALFGPIASIKIMWPRTPEEFARKRNSGFCAFVLRDDAQQALEELNGREINGYQLRMGWSKAVPIPPALLESAMKAREKSKEKKGEKRELPESQIMVRRPEDRRTCGLIDVVAHAVVDEGYALERLLMEREKGNALFEFLFDFGAKSVEGRYYRWRLFSLSNGDTLTEYREKPFQMYKGGKFWVPPPPVSQEERAKEIETRRRRREGESVSASLPAHGKAEFISVLDGLTTSKRRVRGAMAFALDHAAYASHVADILCEKAEEVAENDDDQSGASGENLQRQIALLYVVSDIVHNSAAQVRNASSYRSLFQKNLPRFMRALSVTYRAQPGRLSADFVRNKVERVFAAWEEWFAFPISFINELRRVLIQGDTDDEESSRREADRAREDTDTGDSRPSHAGLEMDIDGEPLTDEEVALLNLPPVGTPITEKELAALGSRLEVLLRTGVEYVALDPDPDAKRARS